MSDGELIKGRTMAPTLSLKGVLIDYVGTI